MDFQYQVSSKSIEQFLTLNMQFTGTIFQLCSFHAHYAYAFPSIITVPHYKCVFSCSQVVGGTGILH